MQQDCEALSDFGKNVSAALFEYHADCFRFVYGGANCTLKKALGQPWDHLLDTPFEWTGAGLQSCAGLQSNTSAPLSLEYGDFVADTSYKCSVCAANDGAAPRGSSCATPAMVRLAVCPAEVWWPRVVRAASDVLAMCQVRDFVYDQCIL